MSAHDPHLEHLDRSGAADTALRCAWLRHHAAELLFVDPSGQLTAQLRDFADLLEECQARGWFDR